MNFFYVNKCPGEWVNVVELGTKPISCNGHSAIRLKDKILILRKNSNPDDCICSGGGHYVCQAAAEKKIGD